MNYNKIYNSLTDVNIDDGYESCVKQIDFSYNKLKDPGYSIDNENCPSYHLEQLKRDCLHDRFSIDYSNYHFECLINMPNSEEIGDSMFVIFSGARDLKKDRLPVFKRWSYHKFVDSIVLNIADPMFYKFNDLCLGWYYGDENESAIKLCADIIKKIQSLLSISNKKLFFFGSSGGGYVSLQMAMYFSETTHIAINPQIILSNFFYGKTFSEITGINLLARDDFKRNQTIEIIKNRIKNSTNRFFIIQNLQCKDDCTLQLFPLMKELGISKFHFGLNNYKNFALWMYSCIGGHNAQGDQLIFSYVIYIAQKISEGSELTDFDFFLIKNISCIWRQREWFLSQHKSCLSKLNFIEKNK